MTQRYLGITALSALLTLTAITSGRGDDTATLLPNAIQYFMDANGKPLANGKVYMYTPNTTTPKTTWTTASKAVAQPQPFIPLGIAGKPANPIYGDGSYRQKVVDQFNNTIWDFNTASTGSGGNTPVVPTVGDGLVVGSILPWSGLTPPTNYLFAYGQAISRTTYPLFFATTTIVANVICTNGLNVLSGLSDTQNIKVGAPVEASCIPPGTTVTAVSTTATTVSANAALSTTAVATYFPNGNGNGSTTFNVPDLRGRTIVGRNNMGGTAGGALTSTYFGTSPNALGAAGGTQSHFLSASENAPHNHEVFFIDPGHVHVAPLGLVAVQNGSGSSQGNLLTSSGGTPTDVNVSLHSTGASVNSAAGGLGANNLTAFSGSSVAFSLVQPSGTLNYVIKVLPDNSTVVSSGVASLGGMTGDITCGTNIVCGSNTISALFPAVVVDASNVFYTAPFASAHERTQYQANNNEIWATYMDLIDATGATDSAIGIRSAVAGITSAGAVGATLRFPLGTFLIDSCVNDDAFGLSGTTARDNPISIVGTSSAGYTGGTVFLLGPHIPDTCNIIAMAGTNNLFGRVLKDFSMRPSTGFYGAGVGNHAVYISAAGQPNYFEYHFKMDNVQIGNMKNGQSFKTFSSPNVTVTVNVSASTSATVTGASAGTIFPGAVVASGLASGTTIVSQSSGTSGGNGVYVISSSQTYSGSALILGNNGGGALNNGTIENSVLMSVDLKNVGDNVAFNRPTVGQGELRGDPGFRWDQVSGATSITINGGLIASANGSIIVDGGLNPLIKGVEFENGLANTLGCMVDFRGAVSKVFGGSMDGNTVSQNYGVGTVYPVCLGTTENVSIGPNNRLATQSGGGVHILNAVTAINSSTNGNYCTTGGTAVDCSVANSAASINSPKLNLGTANGTDLLNVGGPATLSLLHMPNSNNIFTLRPPPSGIGNFRFPVGTTLDMVSTGGTGQVLQQSTSGGPLTVGTLSTTINGTTCTGGSSCTITAAASGIAVGTTTITSGTTGRVLYDNAGVLGEYPIGTNVPAWLATPSSANFLAALTTSTGTGNVVFSFGPTFTGTITASAAVFSGSVTLPSPIINGLPTGTGVATANTVSTLVARDGSGNFSAGTITAALSGNATTATSATSATSATNATNGATVATSSNASFFPLFAASSSNSNQPFNLDTTFTYNPSTDTLTATTFAGNASTATSATSATTATTATNATNTAITDDTTTNATVYPTWVTAATGNLPQKVSSTKVSLNPSTGAFTATSFSGAGTGLTGTAASLTAGTASAVAVGGITGLATGIASWLATPSSANLAAALTDETGTGAAVFAGSPNLTGTVNIGGVVTPILNFNPSSGATKQGQFYQNANIFGLASAGTGLDAFDIDLVTAGVTFPTVIASTSKTTGTVKVSGGLGVTQAIFTDTLSVITMASDTAQIDNSVCINSAGLTLKGTGTLGICLGTSSAQFKQDIVSMGAGLAEIVRLSPKNFFYKKGFGDDGKRQQYGLIAEDVVKVLPGITAPDSAGKPQSVDLLALVPVLVNAMKELKVANDNLAAEVKSLKTAGAAGK